MATALGAMSGTCVDALSGVDHVLKSDAHSRRWPQLLASVALALVSGSACAGFVTLNPAQVQDIFSQPAFHGDNLQVIVNPTVTLSAPGLETINTEEEIDALFKVGNNDPLTIDMFFV